MTYLLDTDTCSFAMKRLDPALGERIRDFAPGELKVSVATRYELEYGARISGRHAELMRVIDAFLDNVEVLLFDPAAARQAAHVRADLSRRGEIIGSYDLLIAGHALALDATLVTSNLDEFQRVADLRIESWRSG